MSDIRSIALVDLSYLFAKSWHGQPRDAMPGHAAQVTMELLAAVRESVDHTIVCLDAPPYWRKEIYPEYKGQRERPSDEELAQKKWVLEQIEKDGYRVAKVQGFEADDLCATLAKDYGCWCPDVRIVSADKDCAQCVNDRVRMFVPAVGGRHAEIRGPAEVVAKFGVRPKDMALLLALCGDKSDNLPGVPKVGAKTAAGWINEFGDAGSIASMSCQVVGAGGKIPATVQSLYDCASKLGMWLKLTTLRTDVPIDADALLERGAVKPMVEDEEMTVKESEVTQSVGAVQDAEFDPISKAPEGYVAPPLHAQKAEPVQTTALAKTQSTVTEDLQPLDIDSAYRLAKAFTNGRLYSKFHSPEAIFTIIVKARELGLKVTTALDGFHIIEGKPSASADMIRSLAERHPDCEYFRLIESSAESATWETKHRKHPEPTRYTYTLAEARQAGLSGGNWYKRPRDMVTKTAGSKLARLVYPGAVGGLYCPSELGEGHQD
jgi:5'-3' exonuclease